MTATLQTTPRATRGSQQIACVLALTLSAALAARPAGAQYVQFTQVPTTPYSSTTAQVALKFGGSYGEDASCTTGTRPICAYSSYDNRANASTFSFLVNGSSQTSALAVTGPTNDACVTTDASGSYYCDVWYRAAGTATVRPFPGNTLSASVVGLYSGTTATATYSYSAPSPVLTVTVAMPAGVRDATLCDLNCGDAVAQYTMPTYVSMGVPRAVMLFYRSGRAAPAPVVQLDVIDSSSTKAAKFGLRLRYADGPSQGADVPLTGSIGPEVFRTATASGANRLAVQVNPAGLTSYNVNAIVTAYWTDGSAMGSTIKPVRLLFDQGAASPYGAGWTIAGMQRLSFEGGSATRGATIIDADGSVTFFSPNGTNGWGDNLFTAPLGEYSTLVVQSRVSQVVRTYPDGRVVKFDMSGRELSDADVLGNTITFSYTNGLLTGITDPAGKVTTLAYRGSTWCPQGSWLANSLCSISDPMGRTAYFSIDASNNLRSVQDVDTLTAASFDYDTSHRMTHQRDKRGGDWDVTYDFAGAVASQMSPTVPVTVVGLTRPISTTVSWQAAELVNPTAGTNSLASPAAALRQDTVRASVTDPTGTKIRFALDSWWAARLVQDPYGVTSTATRDTRGRLVQEVGPQGQVTTYLWNATNPFLLDSAYDGATTIGVGYSYDATNFYMRNQVRLRGEVQEQSWGHGGRIDSVRVGSKSTQPATKYGYARAQDPRPDTVIDPRGHKTTYVYESTGLRNLLTVTSGVNKVSYVHDVYGRDSVFVNPLGQRTTMTYDRLNRPRSVIDAAGKVTTQNWDALFATGVLDAKSQLYADSLTALGWSTRSTDPAGRISRTAYDAAGQVRQLTNRRGQAISLAYDALGRLTTRTTPDSADATYYSDSTGKYRVARTTESVDTVYMDAAGRDTLAVHYLSVLPGYRFTVRTTYDDHGRLYTKTLARSVNGQDTFAFGQGASASYWYGPGNELAGMSVNGGTTADLYYNNEMALDSIRLSSSGALAVRNANSALHEISTHHYNNTTIDKTLGVAYSRDSVGRITEYYNGDRSDRKVYAYDNLGRLSTWLSQMGSSQICGTTYGADPAPGDSATSFGCAPYTTYKNVTYPWDEVGNPTGADVATDTPNVLRQYGTQSMDYDADGNMITRSRNGTVVQRLTWNSIGQLTKVQTNDPAQSLNGSVTYAYDGWGRRIRKSTSAGVTTYFLWDGDNLLAELDASGSAIATYSYYPGEVDHPYSIRVGGKSYIYDQDARNNVVGLVSFVTESGTTYGQPYVAATYSYGPFGSSMGTSESNLGGQTNRLRFAGREYDAETGLYYNRARYYDPSIGRFISEDPAGLAGGINLYAYAGNDPVNRSDPSGLDGCVPTYGINGYGYVEGHFEETFQWTYGITGYSCVYENMYTASGNAALQRTIGAHGGGATSGPAAAANPSFSQGKSDKPSKAQCWLGVGASAVSIGLDVFALGPAVKGGALLIRAAMTTSARDAVIRIGGDASAGLANYYAKQELKSAARAAFKQSADRIGPVTAGAGIARDAMSAASGAKFNMGMVYDALPVIGSLRLASRTIDTCQAAYGP